MQRHFDKEYISLTLSILERNGVFKMRHPPSLRITHLNGAAAHGCHSAAVVGKIRVVFVQICM